MKRILIADDHAIIRKGLIQIIEDSPEKFEIDEASSGREVMHKVGTNIYDMLILDISFPDKNGIEILTQIKSRGIHLPVLMLSIYPEEQYAVRALKAGASGYLTKDSAPEELMNAIKRISAGQKYISQSLTENLIFELDKNKDKLPHELLSNQEYEVLCKIASGIAVGNIAEKMHLSVKTISTYRTRILQKMNLKNNAELTYYAIKNGLVE